MESCAGFGMAWFLERLRRAQYQARITSETSPKTKPRGAFATQRNQTTYTAPPTTLPIVILSAAKDLLFCCRPSSCSQPLRPDEPAMSEVEGRTTPRPERQPRRNKIRLSSAQTVQVTQCQPGGRNSFRPGRKPKRNKIRLSSAQTVQVTQCQPGGRNSF